MKEIKSKVDNIFISKDFFRDLRKDFLSNESDVIAYLDGKIDEMINREEMFKQYIMKYQRLKKLSGIAALYAEEDCTVEGESAYSDGRKTVKVQTWIDKNDGKYGCLVLLKGGPCSDIKSEKSIVLMEDGFTSLCMYSPEAKEVIDMYTIDYHLKQLRKRI